MKRVVYIEMEYGELEKLIKQTYGKAYEFVAEEELMNDVIKSFIVKKETLNEWDQVALDKFKATGRTGGWRTNVLLTDMCNQGLIEEGNYLIIVSW